MDVYDVYEDLGKALVKFKKIEIVSKEFSNIKENYAKVNYVEDLLMKYQQFSKLDLKVDFHLAKNNDKALNYRKEGNEYFSLKKKDYHKAFELYNKSICFAEPNSEHKEHYRAIHGLVTNQNKRVVADLFQRAAITAILKRYIIKNTSLKELFTDEDNTNFFIDLLFHHLQTLSSNMHIA